MYAKLGTSQGRLNYARSYADTISNHVARLEMTWQLVDQGYIEEDLAEKIIKRYINKLDNDVEYFKSYYKWREDMEG